MQRQAGLRRAGALLAEELLSARVDPPHKGSGQRFHVFEAQGGCSLAVEKPVRAGWEAEGEDEEEAWSRPVLRGLSTRPAESLRHLVDSKALGRGIFGRVPSDSDDWPSRGTTGIREESEAGMKSQAVCSGRWTPGERGWRAAPWSRGRSSHHCRNSGRTARAASGV